MSYAKNHNRNIDGKRYALYTATESLKEATNEARKLRSNRGWLARVALVDKRHTKGEKMYGVYTIDTRDGIHKKKISKYIFNPGNY